MKFSRKFSILTKQRIVEYYKTGLKSEKQIRQEYGLSPIQLSYLVRWYNRYILIPQQNFHQTQKSRTMKKSKNSSSKIIQSAREKKLEQRLEKALQENKQLKKDFKNEQLKNKIYVKMVDVAERDLDIPIRKKYGTKQSEK